MYQKILALLATGSTGIVRIYFISLVGLFITETELIADIFSEYSLITALNLIITLGYSTLLLKEVALVNQEQQTQALHHTNFNSIFGIFLAGIAVLGMSFFGLFQAPWVSFIFFIGFSYYQHIRHYLLAKKAYQRIIQLELFIMLSAGIVFISYLLSQTTIEFTYLLFILSSPFIIISLIIIIQMLFKKSKQRIDYPLIFQAQNLGASNGLGLIILWILPSILKQTQPPLITGVVAACTFLLGILMLLPRTLINLKIQELVQGITENNNQIIQQLSSKMHYLSLGIILPSIIIFIIYNMTIFNVSVVITTEMILLMALLAVNAGVSQWTLIDSMVLIYRKKNQLIFMINLAYFMAGICFVGLLFFSGIAENKWFSHNIYGGLIILTLIKNVVIQRLAQQSMNNKPALLG